MGPGSSHQITQGPWLAHSAVTSAMEGIVRPKPIAFIMASAAPSRSGGALAEAVLGRLTRRGAKTVVTTHIGALKAFAHDTPGVLNGSMEFDRAGLQPTYRFRPGVPGSCPSPERPRHRGGGVTPAGTGSAATAAWCRCRPA